MRNVGPGRERDKRTFSYALARELGQPLLFLGDDFARTDVTAA
ncbi:MAG: type II toxin-antitoxin system VapC family toxin [Acidimicrobiales bacterium]